MYCRLMSFALGVYAASSFTLSMFPSCMFICASICCMVASFMACGMESMASAKEYLSELQK